MPKYVNSPRTGLYDKSDVLFGLREARPLIAAGAQPVIVEGPFDAIAVTAAGRGQFAGLAPCGTALTRGQVTSLGGVADLSVTGALVAFDADRAGRRAAVRAYHLLSQFTDATTAAVLPPGQDPAKILADGEFDALPRTLTHTQPLADLVVDAELEKWSRWLGHPEGRLNALHATAPIVAAMPVSHVARQVVRLAERLGFDYATVTEAVANAVGDTVASSPPGCEPAGQLGPGPPRRPGTLGPEPGLGPVAAAAASDTATGLPSFSAGAAAPRRPAELDRPSRPRR